MVVVSVELHELLEARREAALVPDALLPDDPGRQALEVRVLERVDDLVDALPLEHVRERPPLHVHRVQVHSGLQQGLDDLETVVR